MKSAEALEVVGLGEYASRSARALSHGMMARVALCQAFLGDPQVVFLDELLNANSAILNSLRGVTRGSIGGSPVRISCSTRPAFSRISTSHIWSQGVSDRPSSSDGLSGLVKDSTEGGARHPHALSGFLVRQPIQICKP